MAKLHDNLKELGKQGALLFIGTNVERRAREAASDYLSNEESIIGSFSQAGVKQPCPVRD